MIDVIIPVLARPQNAQPVVDSIRANTTVPYQLVFVCSPWDGAEIDACKKTGWNVILVDGINNQYARKVNSAARVTTNPWMLLCGDDVDFQPGWDAIALSVGRISGADVVGTNDCANPHVMRGDFSTAPLVRRSYVTEAGATWDDGPGFVLHEGYDHNYCNPPEAPVWMGDLSFSPLGDVRIGDEVIGWDRVPAGRFTLKRLRKAEVTYISSRVSEIVEVIMESGRQFYCTPDHNWLNAAWSPTSGHKREWVFPEVGRTLLHVVDKPQPVRADQERLAGWLAGIYDGEGSGVYVAGQSPTANPEVHAAIGEALEALEVPYSMPKGWQLRMFCLTGGRQGYLDFLLRMQPVKREKLAAAILSGKQGQRSYRDLPEAGSRRFGQRDKIVSVTPAGFSTVVSLTTTTGNYIAWGYASKNCDVELAEVAKARGCWAFAIEAKVCHRHPGWKTAEHDAVYAKGSSKFSLDRRLFVRRQRAWQRQLKAARR